MSSNDLYPEAKSPDKTLQKRSKYQKIVIFLVVLFLIILLLFSIFSVELLCSQRDVTPVINVNIGGSDTDGTDNIYVATQNQLQYADGTWDRQFFINKFTADSELEYSLSANGVDAFSSLYVIEEDEFYITGYGDFKNMNYKLNDILNLDDEENQQGEFVMKFSDRSLSWISFDLDTSTIMVSDSILTGIAKKHNTLFYAVDHPGMKLWEYNETAEIIQYRAYHDRVLLISRLSSTDFVVKAFSTSGTVLWNNEIEYPTENDLILGSGNLGLPMLLDEIGMQIKMRPSFLLRYDNMLYSGLEQISYLFIDLNGTVSHRLDHRLSFGESDGDLLRTTDGYYLQMTAVGNLKYIRRITFDNQVYNSEQFEEISDYFVTDNSIYIITPGQGQELYSVLSEDLTMSTLNSYDFIFETQEYFALSDGIAFLEIFYHQGFGYLTITKIIQTNLYQNKFELPYTQVKVCLFVVPQE